MITRSKSYEEQGFGGRSSSGGLFRHSSAAKRSSPVNGRVRRVSVSSARSLESSSARGTERGSFSSHGGQYDSEPHEPHGSAAASAAARPQLLPGVKQTVACHQAASPVPLPMPADDEDKVGFQVPDREHGSGSRLSRMFSNLREGGHEQHSRNASTGDVGPQGFDLVIANRLMNLEGQLKLLWTLNAKLDQVLGFVQFQDHTLGMAFSHPDDDEQPRPCTAAEEAMQPASPSFGGEGCSSESHKSVTSLKNSPRKTEDFDEGHTRRRMPSEECKNNLSGITVEEFQRRQKSMAYRIAVSNFLDSPESGRIARWYKLVTMPFILLTVFLSVFHALDSPLAPHYLALAITDLTVEAIFLIEVMVRFWSCPSKLYFLFDIFNAIDVATFLPLALRIQRGFQTFDNDGQCLMACAILIGVVPVLRLLKLLRHFVGVRLLMKAFAVAFEALPVLLFIWAAMCLSSASVLYLVEPADNLPTFLTAMWCSIVSMTTLGYGDVTPQSSVGRAVVAVLVTSSILYTAIPLGIIGSAFSDVWNDRDRILLVERTRKRLRRAGFQASDIPNLFKIFDVNEDGELDLDEFCQMLLGMKVGFGKERTIELFELFDGDNSGAIDDREFVRALFPQKFHEIYGHANDDHLLGQAECKCGTAFLANSSFCKICGVPRPPAAGF